MAADTPTRWYLQRGPADVMLVVELVEPWPARGYRMFVESRAVALAELPHLRRLVRSIDEVRAVRVYDPVEVAPMRRPTCEETQCD